MGIPTDSGERFRPVVAQLVSETFFQHVASFTGAGVHTRSLPIRNKLSLRDSGKGSQQCLRVDVPDLVAKVLHVGHDAVVRKDVSTIFEANGQREVQPRRC